MKPKPVPMNKTRALLLGVLTVVPMAYMVFFFAIAISLMLGPGRNRIASFFPLLMIMHFSVIVFVWSLIAFYVWYVFKTDEVPADKKALWAAVLFLGNMISMPIFWYLYIWKPCQRG